MPDTEPSLGSTILTTVANVASELAGAHIGAPIIARSLEDPRVGDAVRRRALEAGAYFGLGFLAVSLLARLLNAR